MFFPKSCLVSDVCHCASGAKTGVFRLPPCGRPSGLWTTFTPASLNQAWAESRSFEGCASPTPWPHRARQLAPPRRAHGTRAAHICTSGHIHARTVLGGCGGWGLACGRLTIHPHHAMCHKRGVHFCAFRSRLHPLRQVSATLTAKSAEGRARVGHRVFRRGLRLGARAVHQLHR